MKEFGIWAMVFFWLSAAGSISWAIRWALRKEGPAIDREVMIKSLEKRLQEGELSQEEFARRVAELSSNPSAIHHQEHR